jgi:tetratricopeptide (TPR) repeat protein
VTRGLHLTGWAYVAACGLALTAWSWRRAATHAASPAIAAAAHGTAEQWFAAMKPYCNAVEVEIRQQQSPPPATLAGAGYSAACYALAGRIDQARAMINRVATAQRWRAAGIVFDVGHPVADAGDDRSAGPIMELVLEYWPNNYMALYHAGMSEYALGQQDLARAHLQQFLNLYSNNDGWRQNARATLDRLDAS